MFWLASKPLWGTRGETKCIPEWIWGEPGPRTMQNIWLLPQEPSSGVEYSALGSLMLLLPGRPLFLVASRHVPTGQT